MNFLRKKEKIFAINKLEITQIAEANKVFVLVMVTKKNVNRKI